jgi:hypothetical protein
MSCWVADGAEVAAVEHGDHAHAGPAGLVDGQAHGAGPHDHAQAALGVDDRGGRRLADHAPAGLGVELAGLVVADVGPQHVGHAVGLDAADVGHDEHVGRVGGVGRRHAELLEDLGDGRAQRGLGHEDLVLLGNLEALENHDASLTRR